MKRLLYKELVKWKNSSNRKPLNAAAELMKKSITAITLALLTLTSAAQSLLQVPEWTNETAILKGQVIGYEKEMGMTVEAHARTVYDKHAQSTITKVNDDGTFRLEVPMYATQQGIFASVGPWYGILVLQAGDSTSVILNLTEHLKNHPKENVMRRMMPGVERPLQFTGAMAELNNDISRYKAREVIWHSFGNVNYNKIQPNSMSPEDYQKAVFKHRDRDLEWIDTLDFSPIAKEWLKYQKEVSAVMACFYYTEFINTEFYGRKYYENLNLKDFNNLRPALVADLDGLADWIGTSFQHDKAEEEFIGKLEKDFPDGTGQDEFSRLYFEAKKAYVCNLLGNEKGVLQDGMIGQRFSEKLDTDTPLDDAALMELNQVENPFMRLHFIKRNNNLILELARRTASPNYFTIHKTPENSGEEFLSETCQQFLGKVVLIDFWGTWCGPCRSAIKRFAPNHEKLSEKGLVTLYVTDEQSPEQEWRNMASGMQGEHYRLTRDQSHAIFQKFNFTGWPSYLVIDKQGRFIYSKTAFYEQEIIEVTEKALAE